MAYTLDTTVGEILKDPRAVEVLEKYAPGASKNPMLGMAEGMTLRSLLEMPQAKQLGIEYPELVEIIIEDALRHFGKLGDG